MEILIALPSLLPLAARNETVLLIKQLLRCPKPFVAFTSSNYLKLAPKSPFDAWIYIIGREQHISMLKVGTWAR